MLLRGLAMHRSDRALAALLEVIAGGSLSDARAAIESVAFRGFEPGIQERVLTAARRSRHEDLEDLARERFEDRR